MKWGIKGILFDLDDTLFDCTGQLTGPARLRVAHIFSKACPNLMPETLAKEQEILSQTHGSSGAIRKIGARYAIATPIVERALAAYNTDQVENISLFPDVPTTLSTLDQHGYKLAIVTSGHPDRQRKKIHLLGIENRFRESLGTLVLHDDRKTPDKGPSLQCAAQNLSLPNSALLAVGDKLDAEIAAANTLGMVTVRMRHGRQKDRIPQNEAEHPDHEIDRISDLLPLLSLP